MYVDNAKGFSFMGGLVAPGLPDRRSLAVYLPPLDFGCLEAQQMAILAGSTE